MRRRLWLSLGLLALANAYPNRAGGCEGGIAAVGAPHLNQTKSIVEGSLSASGFLLRIGNYVVASTDLATPALFLRTKTDYEIRVQATREPFKGVLIRMQADNTMDTVDALLPGTHTQVAEACDAPVIGICHFNRTKKTLAGGILRLDQPSRITLDVTVVVVNNATDSQFSYSQFVVDFYHRPTPAPTMTMTPRPTQRPTARPTRMSSRKPTGAPVALPSTEPPSQVDGASAPPAEPPIASVSDAPSNVTTKVPVTAPVSSGSTTRPTFPNVCAEEDQALTQCAASFTSSTLGPSSAPDLVCGAAYAAYQDCSSQSAPAQVLACETCVADAFPPRQSACDDYQASICGALYDTCPSCACPMELHRYMDCLLSQTGWDCPMACDAFVPVDESSCRSCLTALLPAATSNVSCLEMRRNVCQGLEACPCGACGTEAEDWMACRLDESAACALACDALPTPAPTPLATTPLAMPPTVAPVSTCADEQTKVMACYNDEVDNANACDDCLVENFPSSVDNCTVLSETLCQAIQTCPCGTCGARIERYFNCALDQRVNCPIVCQR